MQPFSLCYSDEKNTFNSGGDKGHGLKTLFTHNAFKKGPLLFSIVRMVTG